MHHETGFKIALLCKLSADNSTYDLLHLLPCSILHQWLRRIILHPFQHIFIRVKADDAGCLSQTVSSILIADTSRLSDSCIKQTEMRLLSSAPMFDLSLLSRCCSLPLLFTSSPTHHSPFSLKRDHSRIVRRGFGRYPIPSPAQMSTRTHQMFTATTSSASHYSSPVVTSFGAFKAISCYFLFKI